MSQTSRQQVLLSRVCVNVILEFHVYSTLLLRIKTSNTIKCMIRKQFVFCLLM